MPKRRLAIALLLALFIGALAMHFKDHNNQSLLKRGDFPAFYAASVLVSSGQGAELYSPVLQQQIENQHWPSLEGQYYNFAYPPYFAVLIAPLSFFGPLTAKYLFTALMFVILLASVQILQRCFADHSGQKTGNQVVSSPTITIFTVFLLFGPLCSAMFAGQNTALSILLFVSAIYLLKRGDSRSEFLAGLVLGIWLFKPHFAIIAVSFVVLLGYYRALAGFGIVAVFYYGLACTIQGMSWPIHWLNAVGQFAELELEANSHQFVSLVGGLEAAAISGGLSSETVLAFRWPGIIVSGIVLVYFLFRFVSWRDLPRENRWLAFTLCAPIILLVSPHAMYYDFGLVLISLLAISSSYWAEQAWTGQAWTGQAWTGQAWTGQTSKDCRGYFLTSRLPSWRIFKSSAVLPWSIVWLLCFFVVLFKEQFAVSPFAVVLLVLCFRLLGWANSNKQLNSDQLQAS